MALVHLKHITLKHLMFAQFGALGAVTKSRVNTGIGVIGLPLNALTKFGLGQTYGVYWPALAVTSTAVATWIVSV